MEFAEAEVYNRCNTQGTGEPRCLDYHLGRPAYWFCLAPAYEAVTSTACGCNSTAPSTGLLATESLTGRLPQLENLRVGVYENTSFPTMPPRTREQNALE